MAQPISEEPREPTDSWTALAQHALSGTRQNSESSDCPQAGGVRPPGVEEWMLGDEAANAYHYVSLTPVAPRSVFVWECRIISETTARSPRR